MNSFDDTLPEEQETRYRELIDLVQQARHIPELVQEQAVARVWERLAALEYADDQPEDDEFQLEDRDIQFEENALIEQGGTVRSLQVEASGRPGATPRRRRGLYILNALAAVLVIGVLIGASLVIFGHFSTMVGPAIGPVGAPVTLHTTSDGLELSMSFTPGPYFLGELIAVDISLTNHRQTAYQLIEGLSTTSACGEIFQAKLTGGNSPYFTLFKNNSAIFLTCLAITEQTSLNPGQTTSNSQYLALMRSGQNTLTASFLGSLPDTSDPFKGHGLSTRFNVMPSVPVDRSILSLQQQGSEVTVSVSSSANPPLFDYSIVLCQDSQGEQQEAGDLFWEPLTTHTLDEPTCPGTQGQWIHAVGAVGYEVVAGDPSS